MQYDILGTVGRDLEHEMCYYLKEEDEEDTRRLQYEDEDACGL